METVKKAKATENKKGATAKNENAKVDQSPPVQEPKMEVVQKASTTIDQILNPTAEGRVKKLEIFNKLADKKNRIDTKLDELTAFRVSNDNTESKMEFSAGNNYRFKISNPVTINMLLDVVENELSKLQEETDQDIVNFSI